MSVAGESIRNAKTANAEILFIALLTVSVVGIGAAGMTLAANTADDTNERMDQPDFEVIEFEGDIWIEYVSGPILSHYDETEEIRIHWGDSEADSKVVYDDRDDYVLVAADDNQSGDLLVNRSDSDAIDGIAPDTTIEIVWERKNGESEVVDEIYIPDADVAGMRVNSSGTVTTTTRNVSTGVIA